MTKQIAIVYGSGGLDSPYNKMARAGMENSKRTFDIAYDYRVPETENDVSRYLEDLASQKKYDLIIGFGYSSGGPISDLASRLPNRNFAVVDALVKQKNVASYIARQVDIAFLAGSVAGLVTKSKKIGCIFGVDDPNMRRWIAGYTEGAKYIDKGNTVFYSFVGSWGDPKKAERLAHNQYSRGVDIIMAHANAGDPGILNAAVQNSRYVIGWSGERHVAPKNVICDVVRYAEVCVVDAIKMVCTGSFKGGVYTFGFAEKSWDLAFDGTSVEVGEEDKRIMNEIKLKVIDNKIELPTDIEASVIKAILLS